MYYHSEVPKFMKELSNTEAMLRLQNVGMDCGCEYTSFPFFTANPPYHRWEHSVGVALIVYHFTGDMAQAIAGLFHDISTPAFSHVVDFLNSDYMKQESTEEKTVDVITSSNEIMSILHKYGMDISRVSNYHDYPVADNDSPRLSADRLEYTLVNIERFLKKDSGYCRRIYEDLKVGVSEHGETELVFSSKERAVEFALGALECGMVYSGDADRYIMERLSRLMKRALERGLFTKKDLYSLTEDQLIRKFEADQEISGLWKEFTSMKDVIVSDEYFEGALKINTKKRYIDPYVENKGRVSEINQLFAEKLHEFVNRSYDYWVKAI